MSKEIHAVQFHLFRERICYRPNQTNLVGAISLKISRNLVTDFRWVMETNTPIRIKHFGKRYAQDATNDVGAFPTSRTRLGKGDATTRTELMPNIPNELFRI